MEYRVDSITIEHNNNIQSYQTVSNGMYNVSGFQEIIVQANIRLIAWDDYELTDVISFEQALKKEIKIHPDAPSYRDYLKKYNPEFIL